MQYLWWKIVDNDCKWIYEYMKNANVWKVIHLNCWERYGDMIDHHSYTHNVSSWEIKAWKNSALNRIQTHDLCDTGEVLYQLSYQAIW